MGSILKAECECGFESDHLYVGAGMADFEKVCYAPAFCGNCRKLVVADYVSGSPKCPECGGGVTFYDDRSLQAEARHSDAVSTATSGSGAEFQSGSQVSYENESTASPENRGRAIDETSGRRIVRREYPVFEWRAPMGKVFVLPNVAYVCPSCGEKRMRFRMVGFFD